MKLAAIYVSARRAAARAEPALRRFASLRRHARCRFTTADAFSRGTLQLARGSGDRLARCGLILGIS